MKWALIVIGGIAALGGVLAAIGASLPRSHVASRTLKLRRQPQDIWPVITHAMAASDIPVDVLESNPPHRQVTRVKDSEKMFGGTWTLVIAPVPDGSTVTITEDGWVANPIFRAISRY